MLGTIEGVEAVIVTGDTIMVVWGGMDRRIMEVAVVIINATDRDLVIDTIKGIMRIMQAEVAITTIMERRLRKRRDVVETGVEIAIMGRAMGMEMGETTTITTAITTMAVTAMAATAMAATAMAATAMKIPISDNTHVLNK